MKTDDFDTIFLKKYMDLSLQEKEEMKDLFSNEDEFNQLKFTLNSIQSNIRLKFYQENPSEKTKNSLDQLFYQTYQNKGVLWYNSLGTFFIHPTKTWYNQNLVRIAAILVVVSILYPFWNNQSLNTKKTQISSTETLKNQSHKPMKENLITDQTIQTNKTKTEVAKKNSDPAVLLAKEEAVSPIISESTVKSNETQSKSEKFDHPDGIFYGHDVNSFKNENRSFSIDSNPDFLNILTAAF